MAGNLSDSGATRNSLIAQIRAQYGGGGSGSGNWDDAGFDRAGELADLLMKAGVTQLGELSFKDVTGKTWSAGMDDQGNPTGGEWTEGVIGRQLMIGDKAVGYLGDYNNDGTYGNKAQDTLQGVGDEALLGWSARGDGNTSYRVITDPKTGKLVISPGWNSSSDASDFQKAAKFYAITAAAGYGLTSLMAPGMAAPAAEAGALGNGAWLGEGVTSGIGAWDTAGMWSAADMGTAAYTAGGELVNAATGVGAAAKTAAEGGSLLDTIVNGAKTVGGTVLDAAKKVGGSEMDFDWLDLAKLGLTAYGMYEMSTNEGPDMTVPNQLVNDQVQLGRDALQFNKDMYADAKERQVGIDKITGEAITTSTNLSREAGDRAADSWDFYLKQGRPVVQRTFDDAQSWDSRSNLDQVAGEAKSTVEQNFGDLQQQNFRALSRMGVNPNSGRFASLNNQISMQKALAASGAMTGAMQDRKTQAVGMRQQASNLAQGFPAQSMNFGTQSMTGANNAANAAGVSGAQNNAIGANAMSGMSMGANIFGNAAQQAGSNATTAYGAQQANQQGWGNLMGYMWGDKFADGGKVEGPGTGTSDSVPAVNQDNGQRIQLSNGEFVVPADVVKAKGEEFFNKLIEKHHKPVNLGRQA